MPEMKKLALSSRPPKNIAPIDQEKLNEFILGAEVSHLSSHLEEKAALSSVPTKESYAWEKELIREDVYKVFNLRLSEPYLLKLDFLSKKLKLSKHKLCMDVLLPWIDDEIKKNI